MYRVVKFFTDLQDGDHPYHVGDIFPRDGVEVTEERIRELSGKDNRQGVPLIEFVGELEAEQENVENENAAVDSMESTGQEEVPVKKSAPRKSRTKTSAKK